MGIFDLFCQYRKVEKEWEMLEELRDSAIIRTEHAFKKISMFFEDSEDDVYRDIPQSKVLNLYEADPESNVYWIKSTEETYEDYDYLFQIAIRELRKRYPSLFEDPARIIIEVTVGSQFTEINKLLQDIKKVKSLFKSSEVYVVVKRDRTIHDATLRGGIVLKLENEVDLSQGEIFLDGVPSSDMANFVRKVISIYVENNPEITLSKLQYDLRHLHSGSKWNFVEDKERIKALKDNGKRVYYSFKEIGKLPNGEEYVVYKELLTRKHLPLIIEFAKANNIL